MAAGLGVMETSFNTLAHMCATYSFTGLIIFDFEFSVERT